MEGANRDDISNDLSEAAQQASRTIDRVSRAARPAVERIASGAHSAVDSIANATCQVADTLGRKGEQLMNAEARMVGHTRSYISAKPMTSLAIAIGIGVLISRMLSTR